MPCDTRRRPAQSLQSRKDAIRKAIAALDAKLKKRQVKVTVGRQGAIAFTGWSDAERDAVTDACAYRMIMATGSALAKAEIARAEALAGRAVSSQAVAQGVHSHDGGQSWHPKG